MTQSRLFTEMPVVIHVQCKWEWPNDWSVTVLARAPGECWEESYSASYDHLTSPELAQVIEDEIAQRLRLT